MTPRLLRPISLGFLLIAVGCGSSSASTSTGSSSRSASASTASTTGSSSGSSSSSGGTASTSSGGSSSGSSGVVTPAGCITDVSAGHHQFGCDGSITYDVEVPAACTAGGCGVILDVHGLTMTAALEDRGSGMRALGDQNGYLVIQPTAPGVVPSWDPTATFGPLLFAFVQSAVSAFDANPHRVHAMGFSQGGGVTWWLICSHSELFASAAPLSAGGVVGCTYLGLDVPSVAIPILQAHGDKDNVVNFDLNAIPQRDAVIDYWGYGAGTVFEQDSGHTATRYLTDAGVPLEFYEHGYEAGSTLVLGGHCMPGGSDVGPLPDQFGCADPNEFVWGQRAMAFFIAHPQP